MTGEHLVRVEPLGVVVRVGPGETVMRAAQRSGLRWPTVCQGLGECHVCELEVVDGPDADPPKALRLACQLRPAADMTVHKAGVRSRRNR